MFRQAVVSELWCLIKMQLWVDYCCTSAQPEASQRKQTHNNAVSFSPQSLPATQPNNHPHQDPFPYQLFMLLMPTFGALRACVVLRHTNLVFLRASGVAAEKMGS